MHQHVHRVRNSSSKQIANRTGRKYALFSRGSGLESLTGLFSVSIVLVTFLETENKILFLVNVHFRSSRLSVTLYLHAKTKSLSHKSKYK